MPSRIQRPETLTIPISNGDSITVRKRLNVGEERERLRLFTDQNGVPIPFEHGIATVVCYLLDWTLTENGQKLEIADKPKADIKAIIDALDLETFKEIREAVEAHVDSMDKEREQAKASPFTDKSELATSGSPKPLAGPSSTSVN